MAGSHCRRVVICRVTALIMDDADLLFEILFLKNVLIDYSRTKRIHFQVIQESRQGFPLLSYSPPIASVEWSSSSHHNEMLNIVVFFYFFGNLVNKICDVEVVWTCLIVSPLLWEGRLQDLTPKVI